MKKIILALVVGISIIFTFYMFEKNKSVHSEAVFVATDSLTNLSFKIDGKIKTMKKEAGDKVYKNELISSLYTNTLQTKLEAVKYQIKSLKFKLNSFILSKQKLKIELDIQSKLAQNRINEANQKLIVLKYQIIANQQKLDKLLFDKERFFNLYKNRKISLNKYKNTESEYNYLKNIIYSQQANVKILKEQLKSAKNSFRLVKNNYKELDILEDKINSMKNNLLVLRENKNRILISLNDSKLYVPFDGVIAKKFVNKDMVVKKGTFIYSVVNPKDIYIKVLLSEKKLSGIGVGSRAVVKLDALKGKFDGKVYKIMPVSASTFSLVPRDIASGEFTKLDQRFIVKIRVNYNPKMRIGMSGEVKIYKEK